MQANYVHLTLDGEYVTCFPLNDAWYTAGNLQKVAFTYKGHLAWVKSDAWFAVLAELLPSVHWTAVPARDVPDCVKLAEIVS